MDMQLVEQIKNDIHALQMKLDEITKRNSQSEEMPEYDLDIALTMYADHIRAGYERMSPKAKYPEAMFDVTFDRGRKFIKVVKTSYGQKSVHGFICIVAHDQWKVGDILKAASWSQPAKNFARGNVFKPHTYMFHRWMGA